jgi:hypothetical protein
MAFAFPPSLGASPTKRMPFARDQRESSCAAVPWLRNGRGMIITGGNERQNQSLQSRDSRTEDSLCLSGLVRQGTGHESVCIGLLDPIANVESR